MAPVDPNDPAQNTDPGYTPSPGASPKRWNTTANWQDPYNPPSPGDPYWAEWIAANPDYRGQGYNGPVTPTPTPTPGPTPNPQTPPDVMNGLLTKPFDGTFNPPTPINLGGPMGLPATPSFTGPAFPNIPKFQAPSIAELLNDPAYAGLQFTEQQGKSGIENAAAARGTLNDSSTFNALSDYNRNASNQYVGSMYDQALNTYNTNTQTQYLDPWQAASQNWMTGTVNPQMLAYSTQAAAQQNQNSLNYSNAWNQFLNQENMFTNWQDRAFNKTYQVATA